MLREFEVTEEQAAALRGPVGLNLGGRTPPEIALAGLILTWPYLQPLLAQLQTLPAAAALSDGLAGAARTIPWTPLIAAAASVIAALGIERGLLRGRRNEVRS